MLRPVSTALGVSLALVIALVSPQAQARRVWGAPEQPPAGPVEISNQGAKLPQAVERPRSGESGSKGINGRRRLDANPRQPESETGKTRETGMER